MLKVDLVGRRFGRLLVVAPAPSAVLPDGRKVVQWACQCDCGGEVIVYANSLRRGLTKSCGCWAKELHVNRGCTLRLKHGKARKDRQGRQISEYKAWVSMKQRCYNPNARGYENYGGAGVTVCDRWRKSFENFYADMGDKPAPDYSLDRVNPFGNYEPGNCRWADKVTQSRNTRKRVSGGYKRGRV